MLLVVHFSVKRGGLGVMKMYLDDDMKIKVGLARSLGYSLLYVDGAGTLINPSLINRFIGDAADGSSGSVLRSNTGSVDEGVENYDGNSSSTVNTIDNRVNHMLDSSFLEMDLKLSLLLGRLDFNNKLLFDYITKRGLEKYQAAFLLLRVLKDKNAKVLRWVLALNIFDINLINDKIFEICVSMVMYRSKKIINVIKILINSGLDMGKNGYKLLNAATSAKNYEFINYLVGKKSRYDGTSERREKFGLRHNQRWKSSPLKIDQLEDNGLRIASGYFSFNPKMIRHLIDCGAKPTIRNFILLSNVIKKEDYETLEFLLAKAINLKKCPPKFNGLKTAVKHCKDKVKMIMFLVENGADPSACSNTAVRYACRARDMELVTFLVSKGVSLRQRTGNGVSDLCNNKVWDGRLFRYLVDNGANPKSHKGIAMKRVFEENDSESIKFLEQIDMKKAKRAKGGKGTKK
ncbi:putative ankyrin repeat protein L25 [Zancudomyces culisetae]|uniref:Putative ankyrin repeat protein L25 n=1 Tax=Zancudomyces culisetae TaxID=1213189 RepID=A0A1R1PXA9_ZANCU|nr:putative ankyrin repeat protein L25 [Zancudomyces culisetae]|eukprot:OMH85611.1 putative ankyrin repeat protein L25 [Zancudomyces culisetae]